MRSFVAMLLRMVNRFRAAVLSTDKGGNSPDERKIARGGSKKEMRARGKGKEGGKGITAEGAEGRGVRGEMSRVVWQDAEVEVLRLSSPDSLRMTPRFE